MPFRIKSELYVKTPCQPLRYAQPYPILINGVQHQIHAPMHLDAWPGQGRRSTLVLIVVGIDPADLCVSFQRFVHAEAMPMQLDG